MEIQGNSAEEQAAAETASSPTTTEPAALTPATEVATEEAKKSDEPTVSAAPTPVEEKPVEVASPVVVESAKPESPKPTETAPEPAQLNGDKIEPEPVVEVAPAAVLNGTPAAAGDHAEEITSAVEEKSSPVEEVKVNGNSDVHEIESPKIEVKSDNSNSTNSNTIAQNVENIENLGDNAQSSTTTTTEPPPLPFTPPPSQVMVFALSDNTEEPTASPNSLNLQPNLQIPSVIETAPTPEVQPVENFGEQLQQPDLVKDIEVAVVEEKTEPKQQQTEIPEPTPENAEQAEVKLAEEEPVVAEEQPTIPTFTETLPTPEEEVAPEICSSNEVSAEVQVIPPTPEVEILPEILPAELEPTLVAESLVEEITQKAVEIIEQQTECNSPSTEDLPPPQPEELQSEPEILSATTNGEHHEELDKEQILPTTPPSTPITKTAENGNGHSETKENGVGHDAETSATESLNGGIEHTKTIEEMKAEQVEKVVPTPEEQSAVVAAE